MIGERNGVDKFTVRHCPVCNKEIALTLEMARGNGYVYTKGANTKKYYLCSWKCYRQFKRDKILEKAKLTAEDVAWLRFARYPVPEEKLPKWLKEQ